MKLRQYQEDALQRVMEYAVKHPRGRVLLVMPPRSGKTPTAAALVNLLMKAHRVHVLWIVHRVELLDQAVDHLVECGISAQFIGVIAADRDTNPSGLLHVASEATLDRRTKPRAELVIWDEAQHDAAPRRRRLRDLYPDSFHLGITGTPERLGGGLDREYDHMIVAVQPIIRTHDAPPGMKKSWILVAARIDNMCARETRSAVNRELRALDAIDKKDAPIPREVRSVIDRVIVRGDDR